MDDAVSAFRFARGSDEELRFNGGFCFLGSGVYFRNVSREDFMEPGITDEPLTNELLALCKQSPLTASLVSMRSYSTASQWSFFQNRS